MVIRQEDFLRALKALKDIPNMHGPVIGQHVMVERLDAEKARMTATSYSSTATFDFHAKCSDDEAPVAFVHKYAFDAVKMGDPGVPWTVTNHRTHGTYPGSDKEAERPVEWARMRQGRFLYNCPGTEPMEFKAVAHNDGQKPVEFKAVACIASKPLLAVLENAIRHAGSGLSHKGIDGVQFSVDPEADSDIRMCATDGHVLFTDTVMAAVRPGFDSFVIKTSAIEEFLPILKSAVDSNPDAEVIVKVPKVREDGFEDHRVKVILDGIEILMAAHVEFPTSWRGMAVADGGFVAKFEMDVKRTVKGLSAAAKMSSFGAKVKSCTFRMGECGPTIHVLDPHKGDFNAHADGLDAVEDRTPSDWFLKMDAVLLREALKSIDDKVVEWRVPDLAGMTAITRVGCKPLEGPTLLVMAMCDDDVMTAKKVRKRESEAAAQQ